MKLWIKRSLLFISILFLLASCGQSEDKTVKDSEEKDVSESNNEVVNDNDSGNNYEYDLLEIIEKLGKIPNIANMSVIFDGELIGEEFYGSYRPEAKNNLYSVTKSVTALLIGIAIEEGYIEGPDQLISDFIDLDEYEVDNEYYDITIGHLMTMSSGIDWDGSKHIQEFLALKGSADPLRNILTRDITSSPGKSFNYSDASAHLVAEVLYAATGELPMNYAEDKLFKPLGIEEAIWPPLKNEVNLGGCDLYLSCQDMRKIGQLVLNKGIADGNQLVPSEWIEECTTSQIATYNTASYGTDYGYFYWLGTADGQVETISCLGHGGQYIVIVPEYKLVITVSAYGAVDGNTAGEQSSAIGRIIYGEMLDIFAE